MFSHLDTGELLLWITASVVLVVGGWVGGWLVYDGDRTGDDGEFGGGVTLLVIVAIGVALMTTCNIRAHHARLARERDEATLARQFGLNVKTVRLNSHTVEFWKHDSSLCRTSYTVGRPYQLDVTVGKRDLSCLPPSKNTWVTTKADADKVLSP